MKRKIVAGTTNLMLSVFVADTSSTVGAGLTFTHASSGLVFEYRRVGDSSWTSITPVAGTLGTYTSGGIVADGAATGYYEIGIPNAALAVGARAVYIRLRGVANMYVTPIEIELDRIDYQDPVRAGLTSLANASAGASGGLSLVGSAMTLTSGERTAIANEVEAQIIDDTDTEKVLEAIVNKINSMTDLDDLTLAAISSAVRTELATELARIDVAISSRLADADYTAPDNATIGTINTNVSGMVTTLSSIVSTLAAMPASVWSYTTRTLSAAQAFLASAVAIGEDRDQQTTLLTYTEETGQMSILVFDEDNNPITITGLTLVVKFVKVRTGETYTVADGSITKSSNIATFYPPSGLNDNPGQFDWSLRTVSPNTLLGKGTHKVVYAP
jgi:hypothetical protein